MSESVPPADAPPPPHAAAPPPTPRWEDFIDIFHAPAAVFRRRQSQSFWIPFLVVSAVIGLILFSTFDLMRPLIEREMERRLEPMLAANPQAGETQAARIRSLGLLSAKAGMTLSTPLTILILGLVVWIVGKLFGSAQTLNAAYVVVAYSFVPRIIGSVLSVVQLLVMDPARMRGPYDLALGPARFLDPETASAGMLALAARADLMIIWTTVLIGIGYATTSKLTKQRAAAAAIALWVLTSLPALAGFLRGGDGGDAPGTTLNIGI